MNYGPYTSFSTSLLRVCEHGKDVLLLFAQVFARDSPEMTIAGDPS
jgi:hypothetical protein